MEVIVKKRGNHLLIGCDQIPLPRGNDVLLHQTQKTVGEVAGFSYAVARKNSVPSVKQRIFVID